MSNPLHPNEVILALTTVGSTEEAELLVRALLAERLIACGTLLPSARSFYRWEGEVAEESEVLVLLKTVASQLDTIGSAFAELHPYDVPELLVFPSHGGLEQYLAWVRLEANGEGAPAA